MISRTIAPDELETVLAHYEVGPLLSLPEAGGGTANANLTLDTMTGRYFLKRRNPKYAQRSFVAFDHRLMEHLAPYGVGTPLAVPTMAGERWLELEGAVYELYPYQLGGPHDRSSLAEIASAGRRLATFHQAVLTFQPPEGKEWPRYQDPARIREGIDNLEAELRARLSTEDFAYLQAQVTLLETTFPDSRYHALPKRVVHGDYHPANIKFLGGQVVGIFDLDWATVQPRLLDIADGLIFFSGERESDIDGGSIVSLTQTWRHSPERTQVFLDAYLATETLTEAEWETLDLLIRARWLFSRVGGAIKVPEEERADFILNGLLEPLRLLDRSSLRVQ